MVGALNKERSFSKREIFLKEDRTSFFLLVPHQWLSDAVKEVSKQNYQSFAGLMIENVQDLKRWLSKHIFDNGVFIRGFRNNWTIPPLRRSSWWSTNGRQTFFASTALSPANYGKGREVVHGSNIQSKLTLWPNTKSIHTWRFSEISRLSNSCRCFSTNSSKKRHDLRFD